MRLFSFLKRSSEKKEEVKEIKLEQLEAWLNSLRESALEAANQKLTGIKAGITEEQKGISDNIQKLLDTELKNPSIPERAKQIRESNRAIYVQKVQALVKEINFPEEFDKTIEFCKSFDANLTQFSNSTVRNYYVLQQFFENEASAIAANLRNLNDLVKSAIKAVEDAGMDKLDDVTNSFRDVQRKIKQKQEIKDKIKLVEEELEKANKQIEDEKTELQGLEQSTAYQNFGELLGKKKLLAQELEELKKQMFHSFSVINAALKKYERMTLQDVLVHSYLEDFLAALLEDKQLKIAELLVKMKASIANDELELKDKKKDKILQELDKLDKACFEEFLSKHNELNQKLEMLTSEIENLAVAKEAEQIKSLLRQLTYKVEENSHRLQQKKKEDESINIEDLSKNLEGGIKDKFGKDVKIKS